MYLNKSINRASWQCGNAFGIPNHFLKSFQADFRNDSLNRSRPLPGSGFCVLFFSPVQSTRAGWYSSSAPDLYLGGTRFESSPGYRLPWPRVFASFLSPSRRMSRQYLEICHNSFLL